MNYVVTVNPLQAFLIENKEISYSIAAIGVAFLLAKITFRFIDMLKSKRRNKK